MGVGTIFYVRGRASRTALFEEIFDTKNGGEREREREREKESHIVLLREEQIECTFVRIQQNMITNIDPHARPNRSQKPNTIYFARRPTPPPSQKKRKKLPLNAKQCLATSPRWLSMRSRD